MHLSLGERADRNPHAALDGPGVTAHLLHDGGVLRPAASGRRIAEDVVLLGGGGVGRPPAVSRYGPGLLLAAVEVVVVDEVQPEVQRVELPRNGRRAGLRARRGRWRRCRRRCDLYRLARY